MAGLDGWYLKYGDKIEGPLLELEMTQRARDGRLNLTDLVSENQAGPWVEARTLEKFFPGGAQIFDLGSPLMDELATLADAATKGPFVPSLEGSRFEKEKKKQRIFQRWEVIMTAVVFIGYIVFRWFR
jgi:hypothetical protein